MSNQYRSLVTLLGQAMVAESIRENTPINLNALAVGDADYAPSEAQTALMSERARVALTEITIDADNPRWVRVTAVLPPDIGGWALYEVGVFAENGNLFAVGKLDGSYKPVYADGLVKEIAIDVILEVTTEANVILTADPHVIIATRQWVRDYLGDKLDGLTSLVNTKAPSSRKIETAAPLTGGGDLSEDRIFGIKAASEDQAGAVELADAAETKAGLDDKRAVHPKGLKTLLDGYNFFSKFTWAVLTAIWPRYIPLPWSGPISEIPNGWQLCDGSDGAPDLRGRFIVGAGGLYGVGAQGGADSHRHTLSGTTGSTALTVAQMPPHTHDESSSGKVGGIGSITSGSYQVLNPSSTTTKTSSTGNGQGHTHGLSGSTGTASSLPPYYALAWICKKSES